MTILITRDELEGMYEDTGGHRVRRVFVHQGAGHSMSQTWGHLERVPSDGLEGSEAAIWDRVTTLRAPAEALEGIKEGVELETQAQADGAPWKRWMVTRVGEADQDGDELLLQLAPVS